MSPMVNDNPVMFGFGGSIRLFAVCFDSSISSL